ncbi:hypothetical protein J5751_04870 [bacterium]|nr:hypothetical protein [bacterium]
MRTSLSSNNFSSGLVNESINGRYDLPLYRNGLSVCDNFIINYEGGLKNRTGLIKIIDTIDSVLLPFVFSRQKSYIIQFTNTNKIRFLTYDASGVLGYILDNNNAIYEINSPFTLAEAKKIQFAQKQDVMYLCHHDHIPQKLTRLSATTFGIANVVFDGSSPFTAQTGYPSSVAFYENRLFYGGIKNKPTFIYASDVGYYDKFSLTGTDDDLDGFVFDLTQTNNNIDWILPTQTSLICGAQDGLLFCNGGSSSIAMTKKNFVSKKASNDGSSSSSPVLVENTAIYIDTTERNTRSFIYDLITETFNTDNLNIANNDYTISGIKQICSLKQKYDSVYALLNNGDVMFCNFLQNEGINCWTYLKFYNEVVQIQNIPRSYDTFEDLIFLVKENGNYYICKLADEVEFKHREDFYTGNKTEDELTYIRYSNEKAKQLNYLDMSNTFANYYTSTLTFNPTTNVMTSTASDFLSGDVGKRIVYYTETGKDYGIFEITEYTSATQVKVESIRYNGYSSTTISKWYKTFNTLTLTDSYYYNKTISVIGDGGYIGDFEVSNSGVVNFNRQLSVATIGFKYLSTAKSLNLGYDVEGNNTQITNKNISKVDIRFINSAGGKFGTDRYDLETIQEFDPNGHYDSIPLLMNGDIERHILDNWDKQKAYYIIQDQPLPLNVNMITLVREDNLV